MPPDGLVHYFSVPHRRSDHHYGRGESGRRRHASGNRTLSTISDSGDPSHILGYDRSDECLVCIIGEYNTSSLSLPITTFLLAINQL